MKKILLTSLTFLSLVFMAPIFADSLFSSHQQTGYVPAAVYYYGTGNGYNYGTGNGYNQHYYHNYYDNDDNYTTYSTPYYHNYNYNYTTPGVVIYGYPGY